MRHRLRSVKFSSQAEVRVLRANLKWKLVGSCLALILALCMTSCQKSSATAIDSSTTIATKIELATMDGPLSEVNTPDPIAKLAPTLEKYQPQVQILSPKADEILADDRVTVKLQVNDLPIFKHPELGLGNHLHVILDKQTYQGVYDLSQPLVFKNLAAGTHSLRVFASRPWHESFKNEGAYAQTTFHVLTKTAENNPNPQQPLLTYSRPTGIYSAEPIMLDYYLSNVPSHLVAKEGDGGLPDWRIRATVNGQQFILDRWAPIYLEGFRLGKNWVKLELVDDRGNPIPNVYNDTVSIVTYDPKTKDTLAKLVRGELNTTLAMSLVDPNYKAPTPAPTPIIEPASPAVKPTPIPTPAPIITPPVAIEPTPRPIVIPSPSIVEPTLAPVKSPPSSALAKPLPWRIAQPKPLPSPTPAPVINNAKPISIPQPSPVATPAPVAAIPHPQPIVTPNPVIVSEPKPEVSKTPAESIPVPPAILPRRGYANVNPVKSAPVVNNRDEKDWQTQAVQLFKTAGAKAREFTDSIPPKAQRFGHNIQTWVGNAIDTTLAKVQVWRDSANSDN